MGLPGPLCAVRNGQHGSQEEGTNIVHSAQNDMLDEVALELGSLLHSRWDQLGAARVVWQQGHPNNNK